jgi:hypothetical protein
MLEDGHGGPALWAGKTIRVQVIFRDVKIERRESDVRKISKARND